MAGFDVKLEQRIEPSICFSCQNARANRCAWVAALKPVWKSAEEKTIAYHEGKRIATVMVVRECENFREAGI